MSQVSLVQGGETVKGGNIVADPNNAGHTTNQSFVATNGTVTPGSNLSKVNVGTPATQTTPTSTQTAGTEPTVMSDTNIRENVIPKLNETANKLTNTGQYYDAQGNIRNADGTASVPNPQQTEATQLYGSANNDQNSIDSILNTLKTNGDANTSYQIGAIQQQMAIREQQQQEINQRNEAATAQQLNLGGASRYTTSSNGIIAAQEHAGVMAMAQLDAQEQTQIAAVKQAQQDQNYKLMSSQIAQLQQTKQAKMDQAQKLTDAIAAQNQADQQTAQKQALEQSVASMYQQGITDPVSIQSELSKMGASSSLSDIADTLKIIQPPDALAGTSTDYKTYKSMQASGDIPKKWSYFDFQAASANATRAPATPQFNNGQSVPSFEQFVQNQGYGKMSLTPDATNKLQEAYNQKYGGGSAFGKFTTTQLNKGAATAGVSANIFSSYTPAAQNIFINGDVSGAQSDIDAEIKNGTTPDKIKTDIAALQVPDEVKSYLTQYADRQVSASQTSPDEAKNKITSAAQQLKTQGYKADEARDAMITAINPKAVDANGNADITKLPSVYQQYVTDALTASYGDSQTKPWWQVW